MSDNVRLYIMGWKPASAAVEPLNLVKPFAVSSAAAMYYTHNLKPCVVWRRLKGYVVGAGTRVYSWSIRHGAVSVRRRIRRNTI